VPQLDQTNSESNPKASKSSLKRNRRSLEEDEYAILSVQEIPRSSQSRRSRASHKIIEKLSRTASTASLRLPSLELGQALRKTLDPRSTQPF